MPRLFPHENDEYQRYLDFKSDREDDMYNATLNSSGADIRTANTKEQLTMAYNNNRPAYSRQAAAPAQSSGVTKTETILSTGLFAPTKEGTKSLGSVQLKEAVTLPAGSYINLYEADQSKIAAGKVGPVFRITVKPGKLKAK